MMARSGGRVRTYRVNQIVAARPTTSVFTPDPSFDLAASWGSFVTDFRERLNVITAGVLLSRRACDWLRSEGDPTICDAIARAVGGTDRKSNALVVTLPFESIDRAVGDLLRLGTDAEVLAPHHLRAQITTTIARLTELYSPACPLGVEATLA